jgi:hypothetical protein
MANLLQLRNLFLSKIAQNSNLGQVDFTSDEMNSMANEATRFTAVRTEFPRDHVSVTLETGKSTYALPSDSLNILLAYLSDSSNTNYKPLRIFQEKEIVQTRVNWMDETETGEPDTIVLLDRYNIFASPVPDSATNGKKLILTYNYYPATMTADAEEPELPLAFHDLIPIYMAHTAYSGKLLNPAQAKNLLDEYETKFKILCTPAVREKDQMNWFWTNNASIDEEMNEIRFI